MSAAASDRVTARTDAVFHGMTAAGYCGLQEPHDAFCGALHDRGRPRRHGRGLDEAGIAEQ
jgi:hypothetical protein